MQMLAESKAAARGTFRDRNILYFPKLEYQKHKNDNVSG
jgi:hypothetical protein